jgi:hypothetical protein
LTRKLSAHAPHHDHVPRRRPNVTNPLRWAKPMKAVAIRLGDAWVWRIIAVSGATIVESAAEYTTLEGALRAACDRVQAIKLSPVASTGW